MKNSMALAYKLAATTALALAGQAASATCTNSNGQPATCPPPVYNPIPSTPTSSTPVSSSAAQAGAVAGAVAGATSGSVAGVKTGDIGSTSGVTTGAIGSTSGVTTGAIGSTSSAKAGDSTSSAKTGDVNVDGSNNSQYSSTYKAAAASAISSGAGTTGHGCFRGKGGVSFGIQTVAGGASVTVGGGEEYEISKIKTTNARGEEVEIEANRCAIDQVNQATIAAGATPYATNGQIRLGAMTAAKASPDVARAMADIKNVDTMFDRAVVGAVAPVSNTYQTVIVDKAGVTTSFNCPSGTKMVVDQNNVPVVDKKSGLPMCQPG